MTISGLGVVGATAKNRVSTSDQNRRFLRPFTSFGRFGRFAVARWRHLREKVQRARINSSPPRLASVVAILNGQKGQNAPEVRSLPGFCLGRLRASRSLKRPKTAKIALEPASCAFHRAHGEGLPREVCASCRRPFPACRGAIDLADDKCVHLAHDYVCLIAWSER